MFEIEMQQRWDKSYIFYIRAQGCPGYRNGKLILSSEEYYGIKGKQAMVNMAEKIHENLKHSELIDNIGEVNDEKITD